MCISGMYDLMPVRLSARNHLPYRVCFADQPVPVTGGGYGVRDGQVCGAR